MQGKAFSSEVNTVRDGLLRYLRASLGRLKGLERHFWALMLLVVIWNELRLTGGLGR